MKVNQQQQFVFVVCGAAEHIHTLHYSIQFLRHFSRKNILVVTDTNRNAINIEHDQIIDIRTPPHFNHHQAAIYLKTGLHRFLDLSKGLYCYLDTDVIAVSDHVDDIFTNYHSPITFCTDHCRMKKFAPSAIHDPEYEGLVVKQQELYALYDEYFQQSIRDTEKALIHLETIKEIKNAFHHNRPLYTQYISTLPTQPKVINKFILILRLFLAQLFFWIAIRSSQFRHLVIGFFTTLSQRFTIAEEASFLKRWLDHSKMVFNKRFERWHRQFYGAPFSYQNLVQEKGYRFEDETGRWYDLEGQFIYEENLVIRQVEANSDFRWDGERHIWMDKEGNNLSIPIQTDRLRIFLNEKFELAIDQADWQHWNGGVFLFDQDSHDFLEQWFQWTMDIFEDPRFKTRDQGTLIATVWKFGLQQHPTLPIPFNFIADYFHPSMVHKGNFSFDLTDKIIDVQARLMHIYHHFGNASWPIWQEVEQLGNTLGIKYNRREKSA